MKKMIWIISITYFYLIHICFAYNTDYYRNNTEDIFVKYTQISITNTTDSIPLHALNEDLNPVTLYLINRKKLKRNIII